MLISASNQALTLTRSSNSRSGHLGTGRAATGRLEDRLGGLPRGRTCPHMPAHRPASAPGRQAMSLSLAHIQLAASTCSNGARFAFQDETCAGSSQDEDECLSNRRSSRRLRRGCRLGAFFHASPAGLQPCEVIEELCARSSVAAHPGVRQSSGPGPASRRARMADWAERHFGTVHDKITVLWRRNSRLQTISEGRRL